VDSDLRAVAGQLGYDRDFAQARQDFAAWPRTAPAGLADRGTGRERRTVRVPATVMLDLGATAKALAADQRGRIPPPWAAAC
jgi:hypothetical protein